MYGCDSRAWTSITYREGRRGRAGGGDREVKGMGFRDNGFGNNGLRDLELRKIRKERKEWAMLEL